MRKLTPAVVLTLLLAFFLAGCGNDTNISKQAEHATNQRAQTYDKAIKQYPTPSVTNFPRRKTLVDAVVRQSTPNHPWYVYVLGQNGNIVNYFIARSVPVNDCDYLSSTQAVNYDSDGGNLILSAPSLEGIYQSASGCDTQTFFDLTTNAEIQISKMQTYVADRPLKVDAEPIKVGK